MAALSSYDAFFVELEQESQTDLSHLGRWRLSSAKPDAGLTELLDNDSSVYWQSDGDLPHTIEIQFSKLVDISMVGIFTDFSLDESYTPRTIRIWAGFGRFDLVKVQTFHLEASEGWTCMKVNGDGAEGSLPLQCMLLKLEIIQNHQNGKDSHVRGLRIVGPRREENSKDKLGLAFQRL